MRNYLAELLFRLTDKSATNRLQWSTVAICPKCKVPYGREIATCPTDGTYLPIESAAQRTPVEPFSFSIDDENSNFGEEPTDPHDAPELLGPRSKVGEYVINAKIGEGGMGTIYSAVHPIIGKKVAIKVLKPELSRDARMMLRFVGEARAVNQIGHHNIVDIFAFGQLSDGRQYFVMEHLTGQSLHARLKRSEPVTFQEALQILLPICDALDAAHAAGIVHRDLKPENIFLVENKGQRGVKLLDFGLAKLLSNADGRASSTSGGTFGTPHYMSPEQCLGQAVSPLTDIYALGVVMYKLFTGEVPFPGPSAMEAINAHVHSEPNDPRTSADIPEKLSALILHCMAKMPKARPHSAAVVGDALSAIANSMGVKSERSSDHGVTAESTAVTRRRSGRRKIRIEYYLAAATAVIILVLFSLATMRTLQNSKARQTLGAHK